MAKMNRSCFVNFGSDLYPDRSELPASETVSLPGIQIPESLMCLNFRNCLDPLIAFRTME